MPTFATKEQYSCGHAVEMCHKRTGVDGFVFTETLPMPYQCLNCTFRDMLDAPDNGVLAPIHYRVAELRGNLAGPSHAACAFSAKAVRVGGAGKSRLSGCRVAGW